MTYGTSATRSRRTRAEVDLLRDAIVDIAAVEHPLTVRGLFYRMVSAGLIDKREADYRTVTQRLTLQLRREGRLPYSWITDGTRWQVRDNAYRDVESALHEVASFYRRRLWDAQDAYVEVWCEKDAMAGVLAKVTREFDVPLMVARGFASETFLWSSAQAIREHGRPTFVYHFGDLDPSGVQAAAAIERGLRRFAPDVPLTFVRAAVTREQVEEWSLPTRPTKQSAHVRGFQGESVELDAVPSATLRRLCAHVIEQHIDPRALEQTRRVESEERGLLYAMAAEVSS